MTNQTQPPLSQFDRELTVEEAIKLYPELLKAKLSFGTLHDDGKATLQFRGDKNYRPNKTVIASSFLVAVCILEDSSHWPVVYIGGNKSDADNKVTQLAESNVRAVVKLEGCL